MNIYRWEPETACLAAWSRSWNLILYFQLLVFKSLNVLAPSYLSDLLTMHVPKRSLRSAEQTLLVSQMKTCPWTSEQSGQLKLASLNLDISFFFHLFCSVMQHFDPHLFLKVLMNKLTWVIHHIQTCCFVHEGMQIHARSFGECPQTSEWGKTRRQRHSL